SNIGDLEGYITGKELIEKEELSKEERYNEFILTSLRTMWGLSLTELNIRFGETLYQYCMQMAQSYLTTGHLIQEDGYLKISADGIFISDGIMSDLMYV
ncbi:MAG: coproporphyrinogen III oxidase, partial [Bacteroidales bacterium]